MELADLTSNFHHTNINEFLFLSTVDGMPVLVSRWCGNGNIVQFVDRHPSADKVKLVSTVPSTSLSLMSSITSIRSPARLKGYSTCIRGTSHTVTSFL
jgi:hypothetical protein